MQSETAVGSASPQIGAGSRNELTVMAQTTPMAGVRVRSERTTIIIKYFPRLYLRYPNLAGAARPLLFHRAGLAASHLVSPRVAWVLSSTVGQGEMDYSTPLGLNSGTNALSPQSPATLPQGTQTSVTSATTTTQRQTVLRLRTLTASTTVGWQESQRAQASISSFVTGTAALPGGVDLPSGTVWVVGSNLTQGFMIAPQDSTGINLTYQYGYVQRAPNFHSASAIWNWSHRFTEATQAGVYAGIGAIKTEGQSASLSPSGWLTWQTSGTTQSGLVRTLALSSGVHTSVNTLAGTAYPAAFVQGSVAHDLAPRWSFDALLSYQTPLSAGTSGANAQLNMSMGNWQLAFHRRFGQRQNFALDFGLRGLLLSDSLTVSNPQVLSTQTWAFVGFTWSDGAASDDAGGWLL